MYVCMYDYIKPRFKPSNEGTAVQLSLIISKLSPACRHMFKHSVLNYGSQLGEVRKEIKFSKKDIGLQNLWPRIDVVMLLSSLPQDE